MSRLTAITMIAAFSFASSTFAATTATAPAPTATPTTAATALNTLAKLPTFIKKLEAARGKALSVTEKATVTEIITRSNSLVNGMQDTFMGSLAKVSGLDTGTLSVLIPGAAIPVSDSDLMNKLEEKMGKKLGFFQKKGVKAANALRNNSLDAAKSSLANGVGERVGIDPAIVSSLLPMIGL